MKLFSFLAAMNPSITADTCKIHLATWNGEEHPLNVYLDGDFHEWQSWQRRRNFERPYVIALIQLRETHRWLFAGVYESNGAQWKSERTSYRYDLRSDAACADMAGRLVITFTRTGRQSYLNAENWADRMHLFEVKAERLSIAEFPGFKAVHLTKAELDTIVRQSIDSWRTALSNVSGVYLIVDSASGSLYVGSASGEGGIWQRWSQYSSSGHGGNRKMRELLNDMGAESAGHFQFSILEITDLHDSEQSIQQREAHWKRVLLSRTYGLNAN